LGAKEHDLEDEVVDAIGFEEILSRLECAARFY
jgi:hypothetical protein